MRAESPFDIHIILWHVDMSLWIESAPLIKFLLSIVFIFIHNTSFLDIFSNFNISQTLALTLFFIGPWFPRIYATFNFPCAKSWLRTGVNGFNLSKVLCNYWVNGIILNQDLEQGKFIPVVNSQNKGPKVCNRLEFGKRSRKDLLCTKM